MTSPVRIEAEAWSDLRFATLARLLKLADRDHALIKVARIWSWQTENYTPEAPTYIVERDIVESALGDDGVAALVRARLAEDLPEGVRMKGTEGKIEWLWKLRQNAAKGGKATREKWGQTAGHTALERSTPHNSETRPRGEPLGRPAAGHMAIERSEDNKGGPLGPPRGWPPGSPNLGPLTLAPDLDQRSEEEFFLDGAEEDPSPEPSGDRDREPRHGPISTAGDERCKPGDGAEGWQRVENMRWNR